jgi:hypothetical protein
MLMGIYSFNVAPCQAGIVAATQHCLLGGGKEQIGVQNNFQRFGRAPGEID